MICNLAHRTWYNIVPASINKLFHKNDHCSGSKNFNVSSVIILNRSAIYNESSDEQCDNKEFECEQCYYTQ